MSNCNFCGTTSGHHSAECVDTQGGKTIISDLRTRAEAAERDRDEAYAKGQRERDTEVAAMIRSFRDAHGEECRCETCVTLIEVVGELLALPIKEHP